jgi:hypothetical protein
MTEMINSTVEGDSQTVKPSRVIYSQVPKGAIFDLRILLANVRPLDPNTRARLLPLDPAKIRNAHVAQNSHSKPRPLMSISYFCGEQIVER